MGLLDRIFGRSGPGSPRSTALRADVGMSSEFYDLRDPRLLEFVRDGLMAATGLTVNVDTALRNPSMFRACSLISNAIGMLPLNLIVKATKERAVDHPLQRLLHRKPNEWQSAFDFRATMQLRALVHRDAYALVVRSPDVRTGKSRIIRLVPLESRSMEASLADDWTPRYKYQPSSGGARYYGAADIFHLRGLSLDGMHGFSVVSQAREAIGLALSAELAAGRIFKNGSFVDGFLVAKGELSEEAYNRLKESWQDRYSGAENAGKTPLLEGETEYKPVGSTAKDAQMTELRKLQVEEIARVTGVPRPLLMVDETSWGSGIEALGQFFVAYALNPWFEAWQQAIERTLLTDDEADLYEAKFNPAALLRGSMANQADFLSKALGAGGHAPWMHVDEAREVMDMPKREDPPHTMMGQTGAAAEEPAPDNKPRPAAKPSAQTEEEDPIDA